TAQNRLQTTQRAAEARVQASRNAMQLHLQIATMKSADLLDAVNQRRKLLGLTEIADLTPDTRLDVGLSSGAVVSDFNKVSALRDLKAFSDAAGGFAALGATAAAAIVADLVKLEADPGL